jgi:hypothetical protein
MVCLRGREAGFTVSDRGVRQERREYTYEQGFVNTSTKQDSIPICYGGEPACDWALQLIFSSAPDKNVICLAG